LGRWGPASKRSLLARRNEGRMRAMADRYLIENREAAVGVQMSHMRQRCWGGCGLRCGGRKRRSSLAGRSMPYRGGKRLRRAVQRTRRRRPIGGHTPVIGSAWARRRRGSRRPAVERLGERRRLRAWSGPARGRSVFFGGARCAAWPVVKGPPPKQKFVNAIS
jgi:hypothetical protein